MSPSSDLSACPACGEPAADREAVSPAWRRCRGCGLELRWHLLPAARRTPGEPEAPASFDPEAGASCFFHAERPARVACHSCGRFLCGLCEVELRGRPTCPSCIAAAQRKGSVVDLEHRRTLFDSVALFLALVPLFLPLAAFSVVTAPAALFVALRYWNRPTGLLRRGRVRAVAAIILASLQVAAWGVLVVVLLSRRG